jgi:hypothetical protein
MQFNHGWTQINTDGTRENNAFVDRIQRHRSVSAVASAEPSLVIRVHLCLSVVKSLLTAWFRLRCRQSVARLAGRTFFLPVARAAFGRDAVAEKRQIGVSSAPVCG